jgi:UDP-N-acetylglucosamine/UDP-N-acetylgalactosamine diphosphorylase
MMDIPPDIADLLRRFGQEHLLFGLPRLTEAAQQRFFDELRALDLPRLQAEHRRAFEQNRIPELDRLDIIPKVTGGSPESRAIGEAALARGEVAVILVAGGRGSRLGFDRPKGLYPIGPLSGSSLFQIHCEKIQARRRRHGGRLPLLIMTSDATHDETVAYFEEQRFFGLPRHDVHFFRQGTLPVLALHEFRLLLDEPGQLRRTPNGHGGLLEALRGSGLLDELHGQGVRYLYYFQVDNPLVHIADPIFLGEHIRRRSEASSKVVPKAKPTDKLGNLVLVDGRCAIIEYHEPDAQQVWSQKQGRYLFLDGSPAIHIFSVDFLRRLVEQRFQLPWHFARKRVDHLDEQGQRVRPERENALQLETFIFDILPQAERWLAMETTHEEEFAPLKNGEQDPVDNPTTVRRAISDRAKRWLAQAGVEVEGQAEVSPLFALEPDDLTRRVQGSSRIRGSLYLRD